MMHRSGSRLTGFVVFCLALFTPHVPAGDLKYVGDDPALEALGKEVERLAAQAKGTVGVAIHHLETDRGLLLNGAESFPMASTYKIPIAVEILFQVDEGKRSLDDLVTVVESDLVNTHGVISDLLDEPGAQLTIHNLLGLMLRISDNIATDLLFREAGGAEPITSRMKAVGAGGIRVDRTTRAIIANWLGHDDASVDDPIAPGDFNALVVRSSEITDDELASLNSSFNADPRDTATPESMGALLRGLANNTILSEESSNLVLGIMSRCQTGENRLPGLLPPGAGVAHKTGTIGETTNDVGIVRLPDGAGHVVMVVFIKESKLPDNEAMEPVIAEIARAAHDFFVFNRRD